MVFFLFGDHQKQAIQGLLYHIILDLGLLGVHQIQSRSPLHLMRACHLLPLNRIEVMPHPSLGQDFDKPSNFRLLVCF